MTFVNECMVKKSQLKYVVIPDGSGEFTRIMGMLVKKDNLGFGLRYGGMQHFKQLKLKKCGLKRVWMIIQLEILMVYQVQKIY